MYRAVLGRVFNYLFILVYSDKHGKSINNVIYSVTKIIHQLENKRWQCWFRCHMLSGNCPLFGVVDNGLASIHYNTNMDPPDNYQTTYDSKTNIVVFYSLSNVFDLTSGCKFRLIYRSKYFEIKMVTPFISWRIQTAYTCTTRYSRLSSTGNCQ